MCMLLLTSKKTLSFKHALKIILSWTVNVVKVVPDIDFAAINYQFWLLTTFAWKTVKANRDDLRQFFPQGCTGRSNQRTGSNMNIKDRWANPGEKMWKDLRLSSKVFTQDPAAWRLFQTYNAWKIFVGHWNAIPAPTKLYTKIGSQIPKRSVSLQTSCLTIPSGKELLNFDYCRSIASSVW